MYWKILLAGQRKTAIPTTLFLIVIRKWCEHCTQSLIIVYILNDLGDNANTYKMKLGPHILNSNHEH